MSIEFLITSLIVVASPGTAAQVIVSAILVNILNPQAVAGAFAAPGVELALAER